MSAYNVGWDIGGAHLKAAIINQAGEVTAIYQQPCPLWKGLDQLQSAINAIMPSLADISVQQHSMTMTGELVDLFADRDDGVRQIINTVTTLLPPDKLSFFAGHKGLIPLHNLEPSDYQAIASANWLASATLAAQRVGNGLFIDIGSTTTDILLMQNQQVLAQGYNDYQRLVSQELVYTGIIRTAVMAVTRAVQDGNNTVGIMAEYFATMADVYRLTGELSEQHDQTDTADGAAKTPATSARRLARMIGCDVNNDMQRWQNLAQDIRQQQAHSIQQSCQLHLQRYTSSAPIFFVGAGIGRFLVAEIAVKLGYSYRDFSSLLPTKHLSVPHDFEAADCAPAVAVAHLAYTQHHKDIEY